MGTLGRRRGLCELEVGFFSIKSCIDGFQSADLS